MKTSAAGLLLGGLLAVTLSARAQIDTQADEPVDRIVVTGARVPLSVSQVGSAATIIDRDDIERRQARYVTDVLRAVPGFAVSHSGVVGSQTQVRVRGSEANHVLVLIDGVRANDPATGDEFRWEYLATANVQRIEIVRGPQSALWGSDAIGAVVNVITRTDSQQSGIDTYVENGSFDTLNAGVNGVAAIGAWTLDGGVEALDTDGANISRSGTEADGSDLTTATVNLRYAGSDRMEFSAGLRALDATSQFDAVDFATGLPADSDVATDSDSIVGNAGIAWTSAGEQTTLRLDASYYDSAHANLVDGAETSSTASERIGVVLQSDFRIGENGLSLALEHQDTDFEQRGAVGFGDPNQDQSMQVTSAIAEYRHLAGERLSWILSARFDANSDFDDVATGKASLAYGLSDTTRLRASVGTGQKVPTFTERFGFFPDQFLGNPDLKPERSLSWDLGVDRDFADGAINLQASLYWQTLEDEINGFVFDPGTSLFTAANRAGESERSGIELAAEWLISEHVSASASYTYTDASEEDDAGVSVDELRRPRHAGNVTLNFASAENRLQATLAADYGGTRYDLFFPPFPEPQQTVAMSAYWLADLTAQYRLTDSVGLFVRGTNLLDEDYEQVFGYRTLGRAGYVGLRVAFGQ